MDRIEAHEQELARYAYEQLDAEPDVEIYGPEPGPDRGGLVASISRRPRPRPRLDHERSRGRDPRWRPLYQPLHDKLGVAASARASFYVYNTKAEIDELVAAIDDARQLFA